MDLFQGLNEPQQRAVACLEGPLLIVAGAGSGKTRVLTFRIANLLEHAVPPYRILAITFTDRGFCTRCLAEYISLVLCSFPAHGDRASWYLC